MLDDGSIETPEKNERATLLGIRWEAAEEIRTAGRDPMAIRMDMRRYAGSRSRKALGLDAKMKQIVLAAARLDPDGADAK